MADGGSPWLNVNWYDEDHQVYSVFRQLTGFLADCTLFLMQSAGYPLNVLDKLKPSPGGQFPVYDGEQLPCYAVIRLW